MLKKKIGILLIVSTLLVCSTVVVNAGKEIRIMVDGMELKTEVKPIIINNRILLPCRSLLETLGASVDWIPDTETIICTNDNLGIELKVNSNIAIVNGIKVKLDTEVKLIDGITFITIRFIAEEMKANVQWKEDTRTVSIVTNKKNHIKNNYDKSIIVDSENILNTIKHLTVKPRVVGSDTEKEMAKFYGNILESYGYEVEFQEFPFKNLSINEVSKINKNKILDFNYKKVDGRGVNVIAKKSSNLNDNADILVISAHYDSESINNGVIDNATGVAAVMELSNILKDIPLDLEVRFILFSGEENFMSGSRYYVSKLKKHELERISNINIDSIGEEGNLLPIIGTINGERNQVASLFDEYIKDKSIEIKKGPPSDYLAFEYAGRPAITVAQYPSKLLTNIEGLISGDKIERVDVVKIKKVIEMIYGIILKEYLIL